MLLQNTGYCNLPLSNLCTVSPVLVLVSKLNAQIIYARSYFQVRRLACYYKIQDTVICR